MSKRRRGFPSESKVKRGQRTTKGGETELFERLGNNDPMPVRIREALSSAAAATEDAFDGSLRDYYVRD
jgi:hypothetical protein